MSKKEKLLKKFLEKPPRNDLTYDELESLLLGLGYIKKEGDGSRVKFYIDDNKPISIHKPHPGNIIKTYVIKQLYEILKGYSK